MTRRERVRQVLGANPLIALWLLVLLLALFDWIGTTLHAQDDEIQIPCPSGCLQIEYGTWEWYLSCYPLPRKCSSTPDALTMAALMCDLLTTMTLVVK